MKTETVILEKLEHDIPWVGCINSVIYRVRRGVPVKVPYAVAELMRQSENERRLSAEKTEAYTRGSGVKLI